MGELRTSERAMVSINDSRLSTTTRGGRDALWEMCETGTQTFRYLHDGGARASATSAGNSEGTPLLAHGDKKKPEAAPHQLGEIPATSISGNDIMSSCLYVSGFAAYYAGVSWRSCPHPFFWGWTGIN